MGDGLETVKKETKESFKKQAKAIQFLEDCGYSVLSTKEQTEVVDAFDRALNEFKFRIKAVRK